MKVIYKKSNNGYLYYQIYHDGILKKIIIYKGKVGEIGVFTQKNIWPWQNPSALIETELKRLMSDGYSGLSATNSSKIRIFSKHPKKIVEHNIDQFKIYNAELFQIRKTIEDILFETGNGYYINSSINDDDFSLEFSVLILNVAKSSIFDGTREILKTMDGRKLIINTI